LIDHAMTLKPALSLECLRHDINPEMALPACPMSGMTRVLMGFVNNPDALGRESLSQLSCDDLLHAHSLPLVANACGIAVGRIRKAVEITSYGSVKLAGYRVSSA
jgi:hypothetical protein